MSKELFVSSTPHETKVALVEDDQLAEIYFERENEYTLAGSIYKGRVTRVLPGMQSAFVDVGLERDAFLYVTDFLEEQESEDEELDTEPAPAPRGERFESRPLEAAAASPSEGPVVIEGGIDEVGGEEEGEEAGAEGEQPAQSEARGGEVEGTRRWRGRRRRGGRGRSNEPQAEARPESRQESRPQRAETPEPAMERYGPPAGYQPIILPGESIAKFNRPAEAAAAPQQPEGEASQEDSAEAGSQPAEQLAASAERGPRGDGDRGRHNREERGGRYQQRGRDERRGRFGSRERREPREQSNDRGPQQWGPPPGYQPIVLPGESIAKYRGVESAVAAAASSPEAEMEQEREQHEHSSSEQNFQSPEAVSQESQDEDAVEVTELVAAAAPTSEASTTASEAHFEKGHFEEQEAEQYSAPAHVAGQQQPAESGTDEELEYHDIPEPVAQRQPEPSEQKRDRWFRKLGSMFGRHDDETRTSPATASSQFDPEPHAEHGAPGGEVSSTGEARHEAMSDEEARARASFSPGAGHLEEEEIDEEEMDYTTPAGALDDDEFEELEEHIIDRAAAQAGEAGGAEEEEIEQHAAGDEAGEHGSAEAQEQSGNGHAAVRGRGATAGYQQRAQRPGFDRRPGRFRRGGRPMGGGGRRREAARPNLQIAELLKEGQEILVQIAKEPIGKKGARITSHIALPGRFLVYMPTVNHIGVSRKISSEEERQRLKRIVLSERENGHGGFIVRTAADHADENELRADIRFLKNLWHEIRERAEKAKPPALIYHDLNLVERILRDQVNENFSSIWVDTESEYERVVRFVGRFQPSLSRRVKLYSKETPLFEQFGVQEEINKALKSKVWLKSGGYIVINQTEALVAIDVNTGKYVGKTARLEDTIVKTNVDAIREIVRQIRLRDLGGIIVIDFIDMDERKNRHRVMAALEDALKSDRAPSKVLQFNDFGLVAITRKRVKQSLERTLGTPCQYCTGTGLVKSTTTVCNEIWVEMRKMARHFERPDIMLRVHPEVAKSLKANNSRWIQDIEELTGRNLIVKSDPTVHPEQFDIT